MVWTGAIRDMPEGVRTLAERPTQKPWGGFESKGNGENGGAMRGVFEYQVAFPEGCHTICHTMKQ